MLKLLAGYGLTIYKYLIFRTDSVSKRGNFTVNFDAAIDNPLFYKENSQMLFGDAKSSIDGILTELRNRTSK